MSASKVGNSFFRVAGLTYNQYTAVAVNAMRNALKPDAAAKRRVDLEMRERVFTKGAPGNRSKCPANTPTEGLCVPARRAAPSSRCRVRQCDMACSGRRELCNVLSVVHCFQFSGDHLVRRRRPMPAPLPLGPAREPTWGSTDPGLCRFPPAQLRLRTSSPSRLSPRPSKLHFYAVPEPVRGRLRNTSLFIPDGDTLAAFSTLVVAARDCLPCKQERESPPFDLFVCFFLCFCSTTHDASANRKAHQKHSVRSDDASASSINSCTVDRRGTTERQRLTLAMSSGLLPALLLI